MAAQVLYLGGNGHATARLEAARAALAARPDAPELTDVAYPGFEGRPRAGSLERFLDGVAAGCRSAAGGRTVAAVYATGIGALIALGLRARGALEWPLIFQGPVLWGLEHRIFPRVMGWRLARHVLRQALALPQVQNRLERTLFQRPLEPALRARLFEGYARCAGFGDLFAWSTPAALRGLERQLASRPGAVERITVWLGGRDRVVGRREVDWTEAALGVRWPLVVFPEWGHYPMIDVPEEWAQALDDALAGA
jgi:hypothetical protein